MLKELGMYKERFRSILVNDDRICRLLLGDGYEDADYDIDNELDKYIIPHLYVDGTITETKSYIMYETNPIRVGPSIKDIGIIVQAVCHKSIVKYPDKPRDYSGLRYDVLAEYVEELLCPNDKKEKEHIIKKFGIGGLNYNHQSYF